MAPKRKTSGLRVHFSDTLTPLFDKEVATTLPFFLTNSGISGNVDTAALGVAFDSLKIQLHGGISIRIPQTRHLNHCGMDVRPSYRRLNKKTITLTKILHVGSTNAQTSFPYHLDIINGHRDCDPSRRSQNTLPPTLFHKKLTSSPTSSQAETTEATSSYIFSVSAMSGETVVESISLPVRIYDNSSLLPPAYSANVSPEHASQHTGTLRRNLIAKVGKFSARIPAEPCPMVFSLDKNFATTAVPLQLTADSPAALFDLEASITWRLRSTTAASLTPMVSPPTTQQGRNAPSSMILTSSLGLKHEVKMKLKGWEETDGAYSSCQNLAVALSKSALLIPTTHTDHISRRYSIQVEIVVKSKEVGKATVCVEIPLQIGYLDTTEADAPRYKEVEETTFVFKPQEQASQVGERAISPPPVYAC